MSRAVFVVVLAFALSLPLAAAQSDSLWREAPAVQGAARERLFTVDQILIDRVLAIAPMEGSAAAASHGPASITIPMADGTLQAFAIHESPVLSRELAARFPSIRTYAGHSVDDPTATIRLDRTPHGFHAMVLSSRGATYVDPVRGVERGLYVSYLAADRPSRAERFVCSTKPSEQPASGVVVNDTDPARPIAGPRHLNVYRTALTATSAYSQFHGGTEQSTLAALVTMMNRVNSIFERDLSVRMVITGTLIFTDPASDPFAGLAVGDTLEKNHQLLNERIGIDKYDLGHLVSQGEGGGLAQLASVCDPERKGMASTFSDTPTGDAFDVDYMAHEFGHQFGANHSYNAAEGGGCTTREATAAMEPASGSTIMSYVGICDDQDVAHAADPMFNAGAIQEMLDHIQGAGRVNPTCDDPSSCCGATDVPFGDNEPPAVTAPAAFTIPARTPFALTAQGVDSADQSRLTYSWEQYDLGTPAPPHVDDGTRPLFRVYLPTASPTRTFPSMKYVLGSHNLPPETYTRSGDERLYVTGETLPMTDRTMRFRVMVRDNRPADGAVAGSVASADTLVTVVAAAGPFRVTAPNAPVSWTGGSQQQITWDVAGTAGAPVAAANVRILLSTDGGQTFKQTIASSVPNSGSATITVPKVNTTNARIRIEAVGNIFFDVSDTDFSIASTGSSRRRSVRN